MEPLFKLEKTLTEERSVKGVIKGVTIIIHRATVLRALSL